MLAYDPVVSDDEQLASTVVTNGVPGQGPLFDDDRPGHLQMVVICDGQLASHPLPDNAAITLGRSPRCEITIDDKSISRRHAMLKIGQNVTIEDLGSANGTHVRGRKLDIGKPAVVGIGELVTIGSASVLLQLRTQAVRPRRLWTHDYFEARLEEECARVQRSGSAFALLHVRSEQRSSEDAVEGGLCDLVRDSDVLGKYGPGEYDVLLVDTPPDKAREALHRIESKLIERGIKCSVTLICCPRDGRTRTS